MADATSNAMTAWPPEFLLVVFLTFLLGGFIKGVVGFGPPLMAMAIIAPLYGITTALALMTVPTFVMNIFQAFQGPGGTAIALRLWSFLLTISLGIWIGVGILASGDPRLFTAFLGAMLSTYAGASLLRLELPSPGRRERLVTPAMGLASGTLAGMAGVYVFPTTLYLRALGYERDGLIQAMGIVFLVVTAALAASLERRSLLPPDLALVSALAVLPALAGQWAGVLLRRRLSDALFRLVFHWALLVVGLAITLRALLS